MRQVGYNTHTLVRGDHWYNIVVFPGAIGSTMQCALCGERKFRFTREGALRAAARHYNFHNGIGD